MLFVISRLKISLYLLILLAIIVFFRAGEFSFSLKIDDYLYTSWLFNYDYGFMRRALPGELISFFNLDYSYRSIRAIAFIILIILFYLFTYLAIKSLNHINIDKNKAVYLSSLMFLPFLATQWILELGRFDQIIQIMQLLSVICIIKTNKFYLSFFLISLTVIFSALIHEASLIIFIPTTILIFYLKFKNKPITLLLSSFLFFALLSMIFFGKIDAHHANLIIEKYKDLEKFNYYAVRTTRLSNIENIIVSYYSMMNNKTYIYIILSLLYLYPTICFFKKVFENINNSYIFIICLTPISLSIIAFDYFRWIALAFFNLSILSFYLIISEQTNNLEIKNYLIEKKKNVLAYGLISLLIGALGVVNLFPSLDSKGGFSTTSVSTEILTKVNFPADTKSQLFEVNKDIKGWEIERDFNQYKNIDLALSWYEHESKKGNVFAKNNLAMIHIKGGEKDINYEKSFSLLNEASKASPEALNNLGVFYSNGLGVDKNYDKALSLYIRAANKGSATAMYNIGISYLRGLNGLDKDKNKARYWFKKAENYNFSPALHQLKYVKW
ncbi:tetratricopeptide repeat protein [Acinetobacter haemolyticus]|uniref:tetratricopeptide repeat protein n=1 Tax=Acinetobacter haemolyticus TaxID=29430 RepID=UPI000DE8A777|nr:tetratricopeptide repeat protein [Acinetobacter haemolyticus]WHR56549.1 tetratricopeptide repeat protein [Acinetobacter haemolyticus]